MKKFHEHGSSTPFLKILFSAIIVNFFKFENKLGTNGSNDWRHGATILKKHETSNSHLKSHQTWIKLSSRLKASKPIDQVNQRLIKSEKQYWNDILQRVVSLVQLLGLQNFAFRDSSDQLYQHNNGNF